jgi:hypothetical protein
VGAAQDSPAAGEYVAMHTYLGTSRKQATFIVIAALATVTAFGAGHADAAGNGKTLRYVGTSPKAPGATLILEGPVSKKAKKGPWPASVTVTFRNATAMCTIENGVEVPHIFNETQHYPMGVSPFGNAAHPHNPTFEADEEFGGGENSPEPENPAPETETFFYGEFAPNGKKAHVLVKYSFTVKGSEIGSKEAEPVCFFAGGFKLKRAK